MAFRSPYPDPAPRSPPPPPAPYGAPARDAAPRAPFKLARAVVVARRLALQWRVASGVFAIGLLATAMATVVAKRTYRADCVLLYRAGPTAEGGDAPQANAAKLAPRLRELLLKRSRAEEIVRDNGLYPSLRGESAALDELREHVTFRGRDGETFTLGFEADAPDVALRVVTGLVAALKSELHHGELGARTAQSGFLHDEGARLERELEAANGARARFLAEHPEFGATPQATAAPSAAAPKPRGRGSRRAATVSARPVAATQARDEAMRAAAEAREDLAQKRAVYTDQHPDVIAAIRKVDETARVAAAAQRDANEVRPALAIATSNEPRVARRAGTAAKVAAAPPAASAASWVDLQTEWQRIARHLADLHATREDLHRDAARAQLRTSAAERSGDVLEVLEAPTLPLHPARDGKARVATLGAVLALLAAAGAAFFRVHSADVVLDATDIEALVHAPVLAVVPHVELPDARSSNAETATLTNTSTPASKSLGEYT